MGNEVQVIVKDDGFQRGIMLEKVINLLGYIKNDYDEKQQDDRKEECSQELPDDITINRFQGEK